MRIARLRQHTAAAQRKRQTNKHADIAAPLGTRTVIRERRIPPEGGTYKADVPFGVNSATASPSLAQPLNILFKNQGYVPNTLWTVRARAFHSMAKHVSVPCGAALRLPCHHCIVRTVDSPDCAWAPVRRLKCARDDREKGKKLGTFWNGREEEGTGNGGRNTTTGPGGSLLRRKLNLSTLVPCCAVACFHRTHNCHWRAQQ